jgi:very-short-patch-repair endonuclease
MPSNAVSIAGVYSAAAIATAFGGIATRAQILAAGLTGSDITRAVRRGEVRRVRRAHYATPDAPRDAVDAVRVGGRLCGVSAARCYGLWAGFDETLHVAVPPNASRLRVIREHGTTTPDRGDRHVEIHWVETEVSRECWRVSLYDCLRQVVEWSDRETAMACLDTAVEVAGMTPDELHAVFAGEATASRLRAVDAQPGSGSGYESIVVRRLRRIGLRVRQQVRIPGVGRVDAVIDHILVLEIDGFEHHSTREAFEEDRRRDAALAALGKPKIRLTTRRIRDDWDGCVADILAALRFQESVVQMRPESSQSASGGNPSNSSTTDS